MNPTVFTFPSINAGSSCIPKNTGESPVLTAPAHGMGGAPCRVLSFEAWIKGVGIRGNPASPAD